jgi:hypothetical protein
MPPLVNLFVLSALCAAAYLAIMALVFRVTKPIHLALSVLRNRRNRDAPPRARPEA